MEWAKTKARAARWSEEVVLLVEEMRRVLWFFKWKREWWVKYAHVRQNVGEDVKEGLVAYSCKQAAILEKMAKHCADEWCVFLLRHGLEMEWPEEYWKRGVIRQEEEVEVVGDEEFDIEDDVFD